jgi:nucleotide-binding universal stress UspA family protein
MKILVAYDGSPSAKRALEQAAEIARYDGGDLSVVSVAEPLRRFGLAGAMPVPEEDADLPRQLLEAMTALQEKGINAKAVKRKGDAAEMIIDEAEAEGAEMIVMGHRGINAAKRWLLGSVSAKVVAHAPCGVLVVR